MKVVNIKNWSPQKLRYRGKIWTLVIGSESSNSKLLSNTAQQLKWDGYLALITRDPGLNYAVYKREHATRKEVRQ